MKIKYSLKKYGDPQTITEQSLKEGDYILCTSSLIEPGGLFKDMEKFTEGRRYRVNKIFIHSGNTRFVKDSYFQITNNFKRRTKIKFKRNKNFMK